MHWWDGSWHMGWMAMWWILSAALIAIVVWAVLKTQSGQGSGSESPEEILKRRYAKGEIDRETYQRMLTDLKG